MAHDANVDESKSSEEHKHTQSPETIFLVKTREDVEAVNCERYS